MSALLSKADIRQRDEHVRFVPIADSCSAAIRRSAQASNPVEFRRPKRPGCPGSPAQLLCPPQVVVLQRERADTLAGCSEDRVAERRRHERWRRLANAAPESAARHDNALHFRRLVCGY